MVLFEATLLLLGLGAVLYWLLDRHEKRRVAHGKSRHSMFRLAIMSFGLLVLLFSGGCSLFFGLNADGTYVTWEVVAIFGGPSILIGLLIWYLASRRGRNDQPTA